MWLRKLRPRSSKGGSGGGDDDDETAQWRVAMTYSMLWHARVLQWPDDTLRAVLLHPVSRNTRTLENVETATEEEFFVPLQHDVLDYVHEYAGSALPRVLLDTGTRGYIVKKARFENIVRILVAALHKSRDMESAARDWDTLARNQCIAIVHGIDAEEMQRIRCSGDALLDGVAAPRAPATMESIVHTEEARARLGIDALTRALRRDSIDTTTAAAAAQQAPHTRRRMSIALPAAAAVASAGTSPSSSPRVHSARGARRRALYDSDPAQ